MRLGIKDNKIHDICSDLSLKRDSTILDEDYLDLKMGDWIIGDTWDSKNNISLKDSPQRFEEPPKSRLDLMEEKIIKLEQEITKLKET